MIKVDVFRMERFLEVVNGCAGPVNLLKQDGGKENIHKRRHIQGELLQKHRDNRRHLRLSLEIPNPKDYLCIVNFAIGDC